MNLKKTMTAAQGKSFSINSPQSTSPSSCNPSPSSCVAQRVERKALQSRRLRELIEKIRGLQKDEDSSGHGSLNETSSEGEFDEIIDVVTV